MSYVELQQGIEARGPIVQASLLVFCSFQSGLYGVRYARQVGFLLFAANLKVGIECFVCFVCVFGPLTHFFFSGQLLFFCVDEADTSLIDCLQCRYG